MEQAGRISLECAPAQADELRAQLEDCEAIADSPTWNLQANSGLNLGEFILKSDLGDVDGRHSSRIRQIHLALEGKS
jgi:flagellar biosynthesis/type III secretory pathway protein FliH